MRPQILECKLREIPPDEELYTTYLFQSCEHASIAVEDGQKDDHQLAIAAHAMRMVDDIMEGTELNDAICSNSRLNSSTVARNMYDIEFDIVRIARSHTLMYKQSIPLRYATYAGYTRRAMSYLILHGCAQEIWHPQTSFFAKSRLWLSMPSLHPKSPILHIAFHVTNGEIKYSRFHTCTDHNHLQNCVVYNTW